MLTSIRDKTQGIIATIILSLLIIPFAFWGVNSYFENDTKVVVAEVNGNDIGEAAYRRALDQYRNRVDPSLLDNPVFKRQIVETLVQQELVRDALASEGYAVSAQQLGALIRNTPQFQVGNEFSMDRYQAALRASGLTISQYEESMRQEKQLDQVVGSLKDSAIVSQADLDRVLTLQAQTRRAESVTITPSKFYRSATPGKDEIQSYYEQNKARYQEPEQVRIEYIRLDGAELIQTYKPTEDELKAIYEEEKSRFSTPAIRRVSHILLELAPDAPDAEKSKIKQLADDIVARAKKGESFDALAKKYSNDPTSANKGGDLGKLSPGLLPPELEAVVNQMKKGDISKPVRTEYGYQIAKLTAFTPGKTKSLNEVRAELTKQLRQRKGEERYYDMAERFNNLVYEQPDSLEPAAKALELKIEKSPWFAQSGGAGLTADPKVVEAAFSPDVKVDRRNSESIEIGANQLLALRVTDVKPARQKPLADVRPEIVATLRQQKAAEQARELGREMVLAARKGKSLAALAKQHGLAHQPAQSLSRDSKKDRALVTAVFSASKPEGKTPVVDGVDLGGSGYAVFALHSVQSGDVKNIKRAQRDKLNDELAKRRGTGYYYSYLSGLRKRSDVTINNDKL
ncbi:MAG: SurA N-terminal domain-containing protein [Acidiferrobacterales bacterium]|nr:SurA N-terminal domain-containing protein [Acidiferrobacterales bacterium]